MQLPRPRGPLGELLLGRLRSQAAVTAADVAAVTRQVSAVADAAVDADLQVTLAACYELHYRGFAEVNPDREWDVGLLAARAVLEGRFLSALEDALPPAGPDSGAAVRPVDVVRALRRCVAADRGPSLSRYLDRHGDVGQFRELVRARSIYHLKEADPHTWVIPRLAGRAKAALVELQCDEYGGGRPGRMHAELFAELMQALGLDARYGAYWDEVPGEAFATANLMSLLGLHRSRRAAAAGHLAALEMTSTEPNRRYGQALRRLGYGPAATRFYDEHVEADAVHEQVAALDLCGSLVNEGQGQLAAVLWGASACLAVEARLAERLLAGWTSPRAGAA